MSLTDTRRLVTQTEVPSHLNTVILPDEQYLGAWRAMFRTHMPKNVTTNSEEGYVSENDIREFDITIDGGSGEEAPDTLETLIAAYGSCYVPALRVGAKQRDVGDLGRIEIDVDGDLNDDDKLDAVQFTVRTEAEMDDGQADQIVERADQLCKVHDALKSSLKADVTVQSGAF